MRCLYLKGCFRRLPRWRGILLLGITVNVLVFFYQIEFNLTANIVKDENNARKDEIKLAPYVDELDYILNLTANIVKDENNVRKDEYKIAPSVDELDYILPDYDKEENDTATAAAEDLAPEIDHEAKHAEAMEKIAKFPHLGPYVQRLFRLMDTFTNRRKYDNIIAMFDQLILDLWDAYSDTPTSRQGHWLQDSESKHRANCGNIDHLQIHEELGAGYIKAVHRGTFMGAEVAVKIKNMNATDIGVCGYTDFPCAVYRDVRILGEALLIETMQHPLIINMIGYCVHSGLHGHPLLAKPGIVGIYPLGVVVRRIPLTELPWKEKIFHSVELSTLMAYVEHSPFGRLTLYDFERHQFVWIGGRMYLSDMDVSVNNDDKKCSDVAEFPKHTLVTTAENVTNCHFRYPYSLGYEFDVQCVNALCLQTAHIHNIRAFYLAFFRYLFNDAEKFFPPSLHNEINSLMRAIRRFNISSAEVHDRLKALQKDASELQD